MSLLIKTCDLVAVARDVIRRATCMYALGGPVGVYYAVKLAHAKRRVRNIGRFMDNEKDLHRDNLRTLHHQMNQAVATQQETSVAAAQFWNWCEKKARVR